MLQELFTLIQDRKVNPKPDSYTTSLLEGGLPRIVQKVGEEGTEVVVAALSQEKERLIEEIADLTYHVLVLMAAKDLTLDDITKELTERHK